MRRLQINKVRTEQNCNARSSHILFLIAFAFVSLPKPCCSIEVGSHATEIQSPQPQCPSFCIVLLLCSVGVFHMYNGLFDEMRLPSLVLSCITFGPDRPNKRKKERNSQRNCTIEPWQTLKQTPPCENGHPPATSPHVAYPYPCPVLLSSITIYLVVFAVVPVLEDEFLFPLLHDQRARQPQDGQEPPRQARVDALP